MRLMLLQEERWFPTYAGSHKANRLLMEALARRGHECLAVCPALIMRPPLACSATRSAPFAHASKAFSTGQSAIASLPSFIFSVSRNGLATEPASR